MVPVKNNLSSIIVFCYNSMENAVKPLITKLFLYLVEEESENPW